MKIKLFLILSIFIIEVVSAQPSPTPCFKSTKIVQYRCQPSGKGTLKNTSINDIVFKVEDNRKGKVLRSRIIKHFFSTADSLTKADEAKVEQGVKKYRIAFLGNYTDSTLIIPIIVNYVTMIQEAKDENGQWRPIEYVNNYIDCGTGVFHKIELQPMEFIEVYPRKYCGPFFTQLRLKLHTANGVLTSKEYEGYIHPAQFDLTPLLKNHPEYLGFIDRSLEEELERISKLPINQD